MTIRWLSWWLSDDYPDDYPMTIQWLSRTFDLFFLMTIDLKRSVDRRWLFKSGATFILYDLVCSFPNNPEAIFCPDVGGWTFRKCFKRSWWFQWQTSAFPTCQNIIYVALTIHRDVWVSVLYLDLSMSEIYFQIWSKKVAEVLKMRFMHCEKHIWLCAIQNIHRFHSFMHSMINPLLIVREPWKKSKTRQQACKRQMPLWKKKKLAKLCTPC